MTLRPMANLSGMLPRSVREKTPEQLQCSNSNMERTQLCSLSAVRVIIITQEYGEV